MTYKARHIQSKRTFRERWRFIKNSGFSYTLYKYYISYKIQWAIIKKSNILLFIRLFFSAVDLFFQ